MYYWRDLGKRCPLALVLLLVDLPPLPSLRNVVMGGGPRDFKFNVLKSPKEETLVLSGLLLPLFCGVREGI